MRSVAELTEWFAGMRSEANAALAARPEIKPGEPRYMLPPQGQLAERKWDPADGAGVLRDLNDKSCVLLRQFVAAEEVDRLASIARATYTLVDMNFERTAHGQSPLPSIFSLPRDSDPEIKIGNDRFMRNFGGMLIATVPHAGYQLFQLLRGSGILPMVETYIGGRPLVAGGKCTLRLGDPYSTTPNVFHQDGSFLGGEGARALNLWIALTDAGVDAPGLEVYPDRLHDVMPKGDPGAYVPWEVNADWVYQTFGREALIKPAFKAGDAILFDQMCLHRTHVASGMTQQRLAYECWFFPPSPHYEKLDLLAI